MSEFLPLSPLMTWILCSAVVVLSICIVIIICALFSGSNADDNQEAREQKIINELDNKYKDKYKG